MEQNFTTDLLINRARPNGIAAGSAAARAAICAVASRIAHPNLLLTLQELYALSWLHDNRFIGHHEIDFIPERRAFLKVQIVKSLTPCGASSGVQLLNSFLQNTRAPIRNAARSALFTLNGSPDSGTARKDCFLGKEGEATLRI